jgi:hypothetical protein
VIATACRIGIVALVLGYFLVGSAITCACNVPVFRYALERWDPDPYRVTLFHQGSLTELQQKFIRPFEKPSGNTVLRLVDVNEIQHEADQALHDAQSPTQLPWLIVQYPNNLRIEKPIWAGPLATDSVARLIASPLRMELVRRLAEGQTAVWLMLECGKADKDNAVAAQLERELEQLSQQLQLPELTGAPEDALLSTTPLQVTFSLLRVPRGVAIEQSLVEMLLRSEPDLIEFDEPMVFAVFGRGRALLPLVGAGITAENILDSAAFLVGACSCEIKDLNPGFDLLLAADWDDLLFNGAPPAALVAARTAVSSGPSELIAIPPGAPREEAPSKETQLNDYGWFGSNYVVGAALVGLMLAVVVMAARKRFL